MKEQEVPDRLGGDRRQRIACEERLVGGDDHVGKRQQPHEGVVLDDRTALVVKEQVGLLFVDVEAEVADVAALEGVDHGQGVDQSAAAGVHEHHTGPHPGNRGGVHEVVRGRCERAMERDDVRTGEQVVEGQIDDTAGGES